MRGEIVDLCLPAGRRMALLVVFAALYALLGTTEGAAAAGRLADVRGLLSNSATESYHPNRAGQVAYAGLVGTPLRSA